MAGNTFATKGYSTYIDIPSRHGAYDHGPKKPVDKYVIESNTSKPVRTPVPEITNYSGSLSKIELLKEFVHSPSMLTGPNFATKDLHEGYEQNYGPNYENSSSPRYHGQEDRMDSFINKVQTEANRTMKTGNLSSPTRYAPKQAHMTRTESFPSPNKYHPSNPSLERAQHVRNEIFSSTKKTGVLDDLSIRAQPTEPQRRYGKPVLVGKTN